MWMFLCYQRMGAVVTAAVAAAAVAVFVARLLVSRPLLAGAPPEPWHGLFSNEEGGSSVMC